MKELVTELLYISEFSDVRSKQSVKISAIAFFMKVRNGDCREPVLAYRRLLAVPGKEGEAQAVKERLPCVIPVGLCREGHAVKNLVAWSGMLCIDLDHTGGRTEEIRASVQRLPYVCGAFVSPSGKGVKVFVRIDPPEDEAQYARLYAWVGEAVSRHVSHPYDGKCGILTQPCFYSYDPEAFFRPEAEPFVPSPEAAAPADGTFSGIRPEGGTPGSVSGKAPGFAAAFLRRFEKRYPFVRGERNEIALKLGRAAACNGFSPEEAEELARDFSRHYSNADFTDADIRKRVRAGYRYARERTEVFREENRVRFGSTFLMDPTAPPEGEEEEEETPEAVMDRNNRLRAGSPCIPDEAYGLLHGFLKRCVGFATDRRERDLLLLGTLNCCGALFPYVRFLYRRSLCSTHFYLAVVAPAASGKGALAHTAALLDATQDYYDGLRVRIKREMEAKQALWMEELEKARKERRKPDPGLKPVCPPLPYFKIPATTSKSRFIESLAASGEIGCCLFTTEMMTLSTAIRQEYGRFEDILLKAFHHEEVASSYKTDGDPIVVRRPRLAVCMSGTQEQFGAFFRSLEVGLFSRFAIYTCPQRLQWESCAPDGEETDLHEEFIRLGQELFAMHKGLLESPTRICFTKEQWNRHTGFYVRAIRQNSVEGREAVGGIIYRNGLIAMRIAAILTVFRKWDDYRFAPEYVCCDDDFRVAMLLARTLLEHSLLLSTSLPESQSRPAPMSNPHRMKMVLDLLPETFSYTEFMHTAMEQGILRSAAKRLLNRAVEAKVVEKDEHGYCKREEDGMEKVHKENGPKTDPE